MSRILDGGDLSWIRNWIGLFSCYAASKGCRLYACEPDRQALQILKEQQKLYPENLHIIEKALSDKEEIDRNNERNKFYIWNFSLSNNVWQTW